MQFVEKLNEFGNYLLSINNDESKKLFINVIYIYCKYEEALNFPEIIGLSIGTRPDCVNDEILDYLEELSQKYFINIEFGVESFYNKTLEKIRAYRDIINEKSTAKTIKRLVTNGLKLWGK